MSWRGCWMARPRDGPLEGAAAGRRRSQPISASGQRGRTSKAPASVASARPACSASPRPARSSRRCRCTAPARGSAPARRRARTLPRPAARAAAVGAHAAGHHQAAQAGGLQRRSDLATSTSTMAACVTRPGRPAPARTSLPSLRCCVITAVFSPAKEKSRSPLCSSGRGSAKALGRRTRPAAPAPARPGSPGPAAWPTCRRPRRRRRRWSRPAACSARRRRHRISWVWPPETSSATKGNSGGSADRKGDSRCPSRWCTPSVGLPSAPPAPRRRRHRPAAHRPARGRVCRPRGRRRPAPHPACASTCARQRQHAPDVVARGQFGHHAAVGRVHLDLAVQRLRPAGAARRSLRMTSATPVSSQDDSMPSTFMGGESSESNAPNRARGCMRDSGTFVRCLSISSAQWFSRAWLIVYFGISIVTSWSDRMAWQTQARGRRQAPGAVEQVFFGSRPSRPAS
jgi:hypothetical protein